MFDDNENSIFIDAVNSIMNNILESPESLLNYRRKFIYRKYRVRKKIKKRYILVYNPAIEFASDTYLFSTRFLRHLVGGKI